MIALTRSADVVHSNPSLLLAELDGALDSVDELIPMDDARFLGTHCVYEGRSDQRQQILEWFGQEVVPRVSEERPFRVLSVGCGAGHLDVQIAARLADRTDQLHYVGVDPNRVECDSFARLWDGAGLDGARLEVVAETFEDFDADCGFDLIHFVHCCYYMPDPAAALGRARELLSPGGRLVVFQAPREALNKLAVRFYDKHYDRPTLFAEDFREFLDAWGWEYERARVDASLDVSPLIDGDDDVGLALRDFIVQIDSRRLPTRVQDLIEQYLSLIRVEDGDRSSIAHPVDVFVIAE